MCIRDRNRVCVVSRVDPAQLAQGLGDPSREDHLADPGHQRVDVTGRRPPGQRVGQHGQRAVSYTHLRAHETVLDLVCRLLLEKNNNNLADSEVINQYHKR